MHVRNPPDPQIVIGADARADAVEHGSIHGVDIGERARGGVDDVVMLEMRVGGEEMHAGFLCDRWRKVRRAR